MTNIDSIFDLAGCPAPSPAEVAGGSSFKNVIANKDGFDSHEEDLKAAKKAKENASTATVNEPAENTVPVLDMEKTPEKDKKAKEKRVEDKAITGDPSENLNSLSVEDIYEKLLRSEDYIPIVKDIESMTDDELDQAFRFKLVSEALTPDRFLFVWLLGGKNIPRSFKEQFMIKAKTFNKGYKHVLDNVRKSANGNGVHHSTIMRLFYQFLERDEAKYEAQKAKEEAERKAKAAEKAKKAKEKTKKAKTSKKESKSSTAKAAEKSAKEKAASKKAPAPKAATNESVMSLFDMM